VSWLEVTRGVLGLLVSTVKPENKARQLASKERFDAFIGGRLSSFSNSSNAFREDLFAASYLLCDGHVPTRAYFDFAFLSHEPEKLLKLYPNVRNFVKEDPTSGQLSLRKDLKSAKQRNIFERVFTAFFIFGLVGLMFLIPVVLVKASNLSSISNLPLDPNSWIWYALMIPALGICVWMGLTVSFQYAPAIQEIAKYLDAHVDKHLNPPSVANK
jgi:hypothetical protein